MVYGLFLFLIDIFLGIYLRIVIMNLKYSIRSESKQRSQPPTKIKTTELTPKNILKSYIVVPYYRGLSESIKKIGSKYGVQVCYVLIYYQTTDFLQC